MVVGREVARRCARAEASRRVQRNAAAHEVALRQRTATVPHSDVIGGDAASTAAAAAITVSSLSDRFKPDSRFVPDNRISFYI